MRQLAALERTCWRVREGPLLTQTRNLNSSSAETKFLGPLFAALAFKSCACRGAALRQGNRAVFYFITPFLKKADDLVSSLLAQCSWKKEMSWQSQQLLEVLQTCLCTSLLPDS